MLDIGQRLDKSWDTHIGNQHPHFQDLSRCKRCSIEFLQYRQRSNKSWAPGLVKFAPGLSYLSCLSLAWVPLIYVLYNCKPFCASLYNLRQLLKVRLEGVKNVNKWLEKYPPSLCLPGAVKGRPDLTSKRAASEWRASEEGA